MLLNLGIKSTQPIWCTGKKQSHGSSESGRLTPSCPKHTLPQRPEHHIRGPLVLMEAVDAPEQDPISVLAQLWSRTSSVPLSGEPLGAALGAAVAQSSTSAPPPLQGAFDQRMKTWQRWQDAQTMLQKKREMEARLLWANKPDKLQQAKDEISEVGNGAWGLCSAPALRAPVWDFLGWGRNLLGWGAPPKWEG